jgi:hypothetical protein
MSSQSVMLSLVVSCKWIVRSRGLYYDPWSVSQSILVSSPHLGLLTRFLLLSDHCGFLIWGALSDERTGLSFTMYSVLGGSNMTGTDCCVVRLVYSQVSPGHIWTTLYNIFYGLRFETPPTWRTRSLYLYPPRTGWPGYTSRHWVWLVL